VTIESATSSLSRHFPSIEQLVKLPGNHSVLQVTSAFETINHQTTQLHCHSNPDIPNQA
jgi:hypothetical protein